MKMSARFVGREIGRSAAQIYEMWEMMGLVAKDQYGCWRLTDHGKQCGGGASVNDAVTFDFDDIFPLMRPYLPECRDL